MLQHKDIERISELKTEFGQSTNVADKLLHWLQFFDFYQVLKPLVELKSKGYNAYHVFAALVSLPFLGQASVHALLKSGMDQSLDAKKDTYYRLKNEDFIDWRSLLRNFVIRFIAITSKSAECVEGRRVLVVDDTLLPKRGMMIEGVGRLWDHVSQSSVLGLRLLTLGYYDGKSFLPMDFSFHREKGKRSDRPFGLKKSDYRKQFKKDRDACSAQAKNKKGLDEDKVTSAIRMIKSALKRLTVDYILMDSWFTSKQFIDLARKNKVNLIGMVKMGNMNYTYNNNSLNANELLKRNQKKAKRCRKLSSRYIELEATLDNKPIKLFFSRFGKGRWHLILCTDMTLTYLKMMELYHIRWSIEVFFKEAKQYLNLGKCQANDFSSQVADTAISMIQYILLTIKKRFSEYETIGGVFRASKSEAINITIDQRIWGLLIEILTLITDIFQMALDDLEIFIKKLMNLEFFKKTAQNHVPIGIKSMCET